MFAHLCCLTIYSVFSPNQIEWPETCQRTDLNATSPIACSCDKFMLLTFSKARAVHACEDEVSQKILVEAFGIGLLHFVNQDTHLVHVGGEEQVAVSKRVELYSIPWKLQRRPKSVH
jgi:hypothetical protein